MVPEFKTVGQAPFCLCNITIGGSLYSMKNIRMNKNVRALVIITILLLNLFSCGTNFQPHMDYSQFQLMYSYAPPLPAGDRKYYKIIKYLSAQWAVSLKENHYVYFHNGDYYVFHRYPVTDRRAGYPTIISEDEAERMMATNFPFEMDYSQFQPVYSYKFYSRKGDKKYHKIIKYLTSRYRVSPSENLYIYFYDGYYYIFRDFPVTDRKVLPPITISKDRAEEIMAAIP